MIRRHVPTAFSILLLGLATVAALTATAEPVSLGESGDHIEILHIEPSTPLEAGVPTELRVDVEVDLQSADEGIAMIGFNSSEVRAFRMDDQFKIERGAQQLTFEVTIVPINWGKKGDFKVLVNMGEPDQGMSWQPTAMDQRTLELAP